MINNDNIIRKLSEIIESDHEKLELYKKELVELKEKYKKLEEAYNDLTDRSLEDYIALSEELNAKN